LCILPSQQSRWRWRPGVALCILGTALVLWFVVLNALTAWDALPDVLHGERVEVTVTACTAGTCRGTYRAGRLRTDDVLGVSSARPGAVLRATVDRTDPGAATVNTPLVTLAEAAFLALVGLAIAVLLIRATVRAWRRRARARPEAAAAEGDDPLAWVRRRRFGAGG
jgi:hypothetical protein